MPPKYKLFDYVNERGVNEIKAWTETLEKKERAKLNSKLDMLEDSGMELIPNILTGTPTAGILKIRAGGNVQLRPLLCAGPINNKEEFTFLMGAKEKQDKFEPKNADKTAAKRKEDILKDTNRRTTHERVS